MAPFDEMARRFRAAGFVGLDDARRAAIFSSLVAALREHRLDSFEEVNEVISAALHIGSGVIANFLRQLRDLGYILLTPTGGVDLTAEGQRAAQVVSTNDFELP